MKKVLTLALSMVLAIILAGCNGKYHDGDKTDRDVTVKNNVSDEQIGRIKLIVNNEEVIVQLL